MQKRNVYRVTIGLPVVDLQKAGMEGWYTLWMKVATPAKEAGRLITLTQCGRDMVNVALSILELLPAEELQQHTGAADRLSSLLHTTRNKNVGSG